MAGPLLHPSIYICIYVGLASVGNDTVKHPALYVSYTNRVHTFFVAVAATGGGVRPFVRGGEPLLRTRGMVGSPSVYGKTPTRQLNCTPHCCLCTWPHRKANQLIRRCHPYATKSAPQAVLSRMQLTFHATRRKPHGRFALGASNVLLVGENPTCSVPAL